MSSSLVTGNLIKADGTNGGYGSTDAGVAAGNGQIILPNGATVPGAGLYLRLADGTAVQVFKINDANNLDIGNVLNSYLGVYSTLLLRRTKGVWFESDDLGQDLPGLNCDLSNNLVLGGSDSGSWSQLADTYYRVQSGRSQFWTENGVKVVSLAASKLGVRAGLSTVPVFASVGGAIFDDYADASSSSTDGTEDDLYSHTLYANTLGRNGDKVRFAFGVNLVAHATATRKLKVYFAGTAIFDSTAQVTASATAASIEGEIVRVSSTVVRYRVVPTIPGMATAPNPVVGELTGLTLSSDVILKLTGAAAGTGAASADIVAKLATGFCTPAATPLTVPLSLFPHTWIKADAGTYQTIGGSLAVANNDPVGSLIDQGLNGHNVTTATAANRPLLKTNYQNGLPALLFDGVNDALSAGVSINQPCAVYAVMKNVSTINNATPVSNFLFGSGGANFYLYAGGVGGGGQGFSNGTTYTFRAVFNGASSSTALNGGSTSTGDAGSGSQPVTLGLGSLGSNANVAVMEVLWFDRVLSGTEETAVLSYLRTKWAHY